VVVRAAKGIVVMSGPKTTREMIDEIPLGACADTLEVGVDVPKWNESKPLTIEEQKEQVKDFEYLLSQQCFHQEAIRVLRWYATVKAAERERDSRITEACIIVCERDATVKALEVEIAKLKGGTTVICDKCHLEKLDTECGIYKNLTLCRSCWEAIDGRAVDG